MADRRSGVRVWDPLVRSFHWGLVVVFSVSCATQEQHYDLHIASGYAVLALVLVRILWGFTGTRHARFADFVHGPRVVWRYVTALARRRAPPCVGHNPAGGWMIAAMLVTLLEITLSGVALEAAENRSGPLAGTRLFHYTDSIAAWHDIGTNIALMMILLHLLGVLYASLLHRENLPLAMITGRKKSELLDDGQGKP